MIKITNSSAGKIILRLNAAGKQHSTQRPAVEILNADGRVIARSWWYDGERLVHADWLKRVRWERKRATLLNAPKSLWNSIKNEFFGKG